MCDEMELDWIGVMVRKQWVNWGGGWGVGFGGGRFFQRRLKEEAG